MAEDSEPDEEDKNEEYINGIQSDEIVTDEQLSLTREQHEQLKIELHNDEQFDHIKRAERKYLVVGQGGDDGPGKRRTDVCRQLDARSDAFAFRLEDFGLTGDTLDLWAPAFDILSAMASHIVGVLEDFDGGHVWELGYLYHHQRHLRDILWLLKRIYESEDTMRENYDNGMAASHLAALEKAAGERVINWQDETDLQSAVRKIP